MLTNKEIIKNIYYSNYKNLEIRKNIWKDYWSNNIWYNLWILDNLYLINNKENNLLDVWSWLGDFLLDISEKFNNINLFWIDISSEMTKKANEKIWNKAIIKNEDLFNLTFKGNFFKYITCMHVFHHINDISWAFKILKNSIIKDWFIYIVIWRYNLDKWLNKIHYESLEELSFPNFVKDKGIYNDIDETQFERYIVENFSSYEKELYINNLELSDKSVFLEYYKSAMMYRNTDWFSDSRIRDNMWNDLLNTVSKKIEIEINKKWSFFHPWEVVLYKIKK